MDGILVSDRQTNALDRLRHLGNDVGDGKSWRDYVAEFDLGPEHVEALIAMACDPELLDADAGTDAGWAPVHAWRALGQMRASSFIEPLLNLLRTIDDDVLDSDAAIVLGMIGPVAILPLRDIVLDPSSPEMPVISAMSALQEIAGRHPDCRSECIDILLEPLLRPDMDRTITGFAVSSLVDLRAVEVIEPIRDAFRRQLVDISIPGDLEDVEIELGLRTHRDTPKPRYVHFAPVPEPIGLEKIGRNEPCPCGSGRKYKKCCLH